MAGNASRVGRLGPWLPGRCHVLRFAPWAGQAQPGGLVPGRPRWRPAGARWRCPRVGAKRPGGGTMSSSGLPRRMRVTIRRP